MEEVTFVGLFIYVFHHRLNQLYLISESGAKKTLASQ